MRKVEGCHALARNLRLTRLALGGGKGLREPAVLTTDRAFVLKDAKSGLAFRRGAGLEARSLVFFAVLNQSALRCSHSSSSAKCHSLLPWMRVKCISGADKSRSM